MTEGGAGGERGLQVRLDSGLQHLLLGLAIPSCCGLSTWIGSSSISARRLEPLNAHSLCGSHLAEAKATLSWLPRARAPGSAPIAFSPLPCP